MLNLMIYTSFAFAVDYRESIGSEVVEVKLCLVGGGSLDFSGDVSSIEVVEE